MIYPMPPKGVPLSPEQAAKLALARAKAHEAIKEKAAITATMNTKEKNLKKQLVKDFVKQLKSPDEGSDQTEADPDPVAKPEPEPVPVKKTGRPRKVVEAKNEPVPEPKVEVKVEVKPEVKPEPEPKKKVKKVIYQSDSDSDSEVVIVKRKPKQRKQKVIYQEDSDSDSEIVYRQKSRSRPREYKEPEPEPELPRRTNYANHLINLCKAGYNFS